MSEEATNSEEFSSEDENSLTEGAAEAEIQETTETDESAPEDKPRKPTAKDRIDELTRLRREAERDAEYWRAKALQAPEAPRQEAKPQEPSAPDPDKYPAGEFDTAYIKDLARWEAKQEVAEAIKAVKAEQTQSQTEAAWSKRLEQASEAYPDFTEKVLLGAQRNEWACSPEMGEALRASDKGPDLAYHLASNPTEAARISRLSPALQYMELGKLEAKLTQPKPKTVSSAPDATPQVRGSGGKFTVQPDTNDFAAFEKQYGNG